MFGKEMLVILVVVVLLVGAEQVKGSIGDVWISPEQPTVNDDITIFVAGSEPYGGVSITDSIFNINGALLGLDLYLDVGPLTVPTPWSHSEDIGTLPMGAYGLTVNTIVESEHTLNDTYFTPFEVVPEPSTISLLAAGVVGVQTTWYRKLEG